MRRQAAAPSVRKEAFPGRHCPVFFYEGRLQAAHLFQGGVAPEAVVFIYGFKVRGHQDGFYLALQGAFGRRPCSRQMGTDGITILLFPG